jgi:hypothetical protein
MIQGQPGKKIARPYLKSKKDNWVLVAYTCNPSYSGGRDEEAN